MNPIPFILHHCEERGLVRAVKTAATKARSPPSRTHLLGSRHRPTSGFSSRDFSRRDVFRAVWRAREFTTMWMILLGIITMILPAAEGVQITVEGPPQRIV